MRSLSKEENYDNCDNKSLLTDHWDLSRTGATSDLASPEFAQLKPDYLIPARGDETRWPMIYKYNSDQHRWWNVNKMVKAWECLYIQFTEAFTEIYIDNSQICFQAKADLALEMNVGLWETWLCHNESVMTDLKNVNNSQTDSILLLNHRGLLINNEKYFGTF